MPSDSGLLLIPTYRKNRNQRSLLLMLCHVTSVVQSGVIKFGFDSGKQTYFCKDCQHKFREPSLLKKVKFSPGLITLTLDLYFSGLSLRKIARNVSDHFNIDVNFSTIYDWIQKYVPVISNYVNSLKPQLSDTWHADELFVKMKGGETRKGDTGIAYLWNVMDRQSRFLIASKLSEHRDTEGAIKAFNEAIRNAHGQTPNQIHTDALRAYKEGISKTLAFRLTILLNVVLPSLMPTITG